MMCARLLRPESEMKYGRVQQKAGAWMDRLIHSYDKGLQWVLAHQRATLWVALGTLLLTGLLYTVVPKGFFTQQDTGLIQAISQGPHTVSFASMARQEEHTSELKSLMRISYAVFCLKKKNNIKNS